MKIHQDFDRSIVVVSENLTQLLPIKPKPLLYPKDSTLLTDSRQTSKTENVTNDIILVSSMFEHERIQISFVCQSMFNRKLIIDRVNLQFVRVTNIDHFVISSLLINSEENSSGHFDNREIKEKLTFICRCLADTKEKRTTKQNNRFDVDDNDRIVTNNINKKEGQSKRCAQIVVLNS